jgi:hypothetical protein
VRILLQNLDAQPCAADRGHNLAERIAEEVTWVRILEVLDPRFIRERREPPRRPCNVVDDAFVQRVNALPWKVIATVAPIAREHPLRRVEVYQHEHAARLEDCGDT